MEKQKQQIKKEIPFINKLIPVLLIVPIVIAAIIITLIQLNKVGDNATVATVNGEPIVVAELKLEMQSERSSVITYFQQKYNAVVDKKFWTTEFDGQTPTDYLKNTALEKLKRIKTEQILARDNGVVPDISYSYFLKEFAAENQKRSEAVKNGQPIYGVEQFNESTYFTDYHSKMIIDVKTELSKEGKELASDKAILKAHYEATKEKLYKKTDIYVLKSYAYDYRIDGKETNVTEAQGKERLVKVLELVKQNKSDDEIKAKFPGIRIMGLDLSEENASSASKTNPIMVGKAKELSAGQISDIFIEQNSGQSSVILMKCFSKKPGGYKPFDEIESACKMDYESVYYEKLIDKLTPQSKLVTIDKVLKKVKID